MAVAAGRDDDVGLSSDLQSCLPEDESCPNCGGHGWPDLAPHAAANPADRGPCQICLSSAIDNVQYSRAVGTEARTGSVDGVGHGPQLIPGAE